MLSNLMLRSNGKCIRIWINCIKNLHLRRYIDGYSRVPTGQGKVREICFFFKVREKSGSSVKWSGKLENLLKVREF